MDAATPSSARSYSYSITTGFPAWASPADRPQTGTAATATPASATASSGYLQGAPHVVATQALGSGGPTSGASSTYSMLGADRSPPTIHMSSPGPVHQGVGRGVGPVTPASPMQYFAVLKRRAAGGAGPSSAVSPPLSSAGGDPYSPAAMYGSTAHPSPIAHHERAGV